MTAKTVWIGKRAVGDGHPCYLIAEAGVNHNGSLENAIKLIDVAVECQADAVKFQKRTIRDIMTETMYKQPYHSETAMATTYGEHREMLELTEDDFRFFSEYADKRGIQFMGSAWDPKSADFLQSLDVPAFKVASADLTNLPLLDHIARKGRPMIVSTGMSTLEEVREAAQTVLSHTDQLILLHCVSTYPCDNEKVNLSVMETLRREFGCLVGYSGHERGVSISVGAAALGACVVERHFTLDRTMPGPDHAASLEPDGLRRVVHYIRSIEEARGTGVKDIQPEEIPIRHRLAKSLVAAVDIPLGTVISAEMLTSKSPGTGLSPKYLEAVTGRIAGQSILRDTLIPLKAIEWERP